MVVGLTLALAGCARRSDVRHYYSVEPALRATTSTHVVSVQRAYGIPSMGARHRAIRGLWVELAIENLGDQRWHLRATDLAVISSGKSAAGFASDPNINPKVRLESEAFVEAGTVVRVWVRFDNVPTQLERAASTGVDAPGPVGIRVRAPSGDLTLMLVDPARGEPIWSAGDWPYFATLSFGTGFSLNPDAPMDEPQGGMGLDVCMSGHRRVGELDIGAVGVVRAGIETHPLRGGAFGFLGGGLTTGYTLFPASWLYLRPSVSFVVGQSGHAAFETIPARLFTELHMGFPRRSSYPYRERPSANTLGWYLRVETGITNFSDIEEPHTFGMSFGVVMRGGS
jgi:hypothetical protein